MKKLLKKVIVVVTAVMMLVGLLPAAVMAEGTNVDFDHSASIIIHKTDSKYPNPNPLPGAEFDVYKIASLNTGSTTQLTYTPVTGTGLSDSQLQSLGTLTTAELEALVITVKEEVEKNKLGAVQHVTTDDNGTATVTVNKRNDDKGGLGLYLVVETAAPAGYVIGAPFIVDVPRTVTTSTQNDDGTTTTTSEWDYDVDVTPKNGSNTVTKTYTVLRNEKWIEDTTLKTGDIIKYVVEGYAPQFTAKELEESPKIRIYDVMTGGLKLKISDDYPFLLQMKQNGSETFDTVNNYIASDVADDPKTDAIETAVGALPDDGKTSFDITINDLDTIKNHNGQKIKLTYYATVDASKFTTYELTNNASFDTKGGTTSDETKSYTFAIEINKSGSDVAALAGVEFELYSDADVADGKVNTDATPIATGTTDSNGKITFNGLDADATTVESADGEVTTGTVYWLKETKTVSGYTLLAKLVKVEIIPTMESGKATGAMQYRINDGDLTSDTTALPRTAIAAIKNNKGFSLPSTGGMGTYIFTIGGIVIMAAAAVVLVAMKKRNRA